MLVNDNTPGRMDGFQEARGLVPYALFSGLPKESCELNDLNVPASTIVDNLKRSALEQTHPLKPIRFCETRNLGIPISRVYG